ncbi:hypothetical protein AB0C65_38515 [Nocardia sp. NPDC048505]|uniref:hypothetical protein n=1 Tax=Nocardia sp. NPDC048505 TaxID=3155756 RepID=UPI0033C84E7C
MTSPDFDPETARLTALTTLRAWARQRDRMPEQRARLLATAWRAGEHNIRELARIADVSRQTVYEDLQSQGVDPKTDRGTAASRPRYAPLDHGQVSDLAEQMAAVLGPAMLTAEPEPLAEAAWFAHKAITFIAGLLDPDQPADEEQRRSRAAGFDEIACSADHMRRAAYQQWAAEFGPSELARYTEDTAINAAEIREALPTSTATITVELPDGVGSVVVTLATAAGTKSADPEGWTTWTSNATLPLSPITGEAHLEIQSLLAGLSTVITRQLHPDLLDLDVR